MRDALDAAWGDFPTWDVGYDWLRYTGSARPDAGWVAAVTAHSLVTFIQEAYSTRSSEGYDVGVADCRFAEARAREVHPGVRSIAVCASDGSYADGWDASGYGRGWSDTATLPFFFYGAHGVIDSAVAGAKAGRGAHLLVLGTDGGAGRWVPETWGPTNLIGQVVGASPVADTDLNHVHGDYTGGAAVAPAPEPPKEDDVLYIKNPHQTAYDEVWCTDGVFRRHVGPAEWAFQSGPFGGHKLVAADAEWFDSLRDIATAGGGGTVDPAALANAVADNLAHRLAS